MVIWKLAAMAAASVMLTAAPAVAVEPISVTYTVTGAPGAYTYDFSFTNNDTGTAGIYYLGVGNLVSNVTGTPGGWTEYLFSQPSFVPYGGSATAYTNDWCYGPYTVCTASGINSGQTVGGFQVLDTGASILSTVPFFAWAYNGVDTNADGHFNTDTNPGFEGQATLAISAVPEPESWALMLVGFGAVGASLRRRRRNHSLLPLA